MLDRLVMQGDALELLRLLPDEYIQCCITSPPYFGLRDYGVAGQIGLEETPTEFVDVLVEVFREVRRVLRDDGTLWLNLGDSYAANRTYQVPSTKGGPKHSESQSVGGKGARVPDGMKAKDLIGIPWMVAFALRADGWYLRQDIIWSKPNAMPESVKDRCTRSHEYVFMLTKSKKYLYDHEAIKEEAVSTNRTPWSPKSDKQGKTGMEAQSTSAGRRYTGFNERYIESIKDGGPALRNKRDVWSIATQAFPEAHFAVFPEKLVEPMVLAGSQEGDFVLDPFCGAGTTGKVAVRHGRRFVGLELNPEFCEMSRKRIEEGIDLKVAV